MPLFLKVGVRIRERDPIPRRGSSLEGRQRLQEGRRDLQALASDKAQGRDAAAVPGKGCRGRLPGRGSIGARHGGREHERCGAQARSRERGVGVGAVEGHEPERREKRATTDGQRGRRRGAEREIVGLVDDGAGVDAGRWCCRGGASSPRAAERVAGRNLPLRRLPGHVFADDGALERGEVGDEHAPRTATSMRDLEIGVGAADDAELLTQVSRDERLRGRCGRRGGGSRRRSGGGGHDGAGNG